MPRLDPAALSRLPPDVDRPRYDRAALRAGIVHLGVGAFQRAHLAVITECALHANHDLRWGIVGVSLRQPDTRDALKPQGGLYTVAIRDAADDGAPRERLQVVGNLLDVLVAPEDPVAVVERIAHADTRIASLTVTEKGYCHDPATHALRFEHPDIAHDLVHEAAPRSAVGMLVRGLQVRRERGLGPITLMSLDNLPANGHTLKGLVLAFAHRVDAGLRAWIETGCTFPNSMVDRIVPRTVDADRERIGARLGVYDAWPVLGEPFLDWAVEDDFAAGRPDWAVGGARFVADAQPWEMLKLRMVNGSHSALAYLGAMAGFATVDRAIAQPWLRDYLATLMHDDIAPTLPPLPGLDLSQYAARLLERFANPALQHQTRQIAMDGSQKLPQRLLGTLADRLRADAPIDQLALAVAAWIHHLRGIDEAGRRYDIQDPLAEVLAQALAQAEEACADVADAVAGERRRIEVFARRAGLFGDLSVQPHFVAEVARHTLALRERGVQVAVEDCSPRPLDVITLGESMVMLVADEPGALADAERFTKHLAGAETNVAIGLSRLGLRVRWISRLGADSFGDFVRRAVARENVDCTRVTIDPQRSTGFMLKARTLDGRDPTVEYFRRGSAASALSLADFDALTFLAARHLHVTGITPALSAGAAELVAHAMRFMRDGGRTVSFDPNLRSRLWPDHDMMVQHINRLAAMAHWVLPGLAEGRALTGLDAPADIAAFYLERGAEVVVIKLGAAGAYYRTATDQGTVPGVPVARVVDTVGAGDGFAAGVISARLEGLDWRSSLARGNWIGAQVVQMPGDMDGLPRRQVPNVP